MFEKIMVTSCKGKEFFDSLEQAKAYIEKYCSTVSTRLFKKIDDKWIPIGSTWPKSSI